MFGLLKTLFYVLVIILIGCGIFIWSYRVPMTSYALTHLLNNPTSVADVDISLTLSRVSGKNVAIRNPPASDKKIVHAVKSKVLEVKLNLRSFFSKPVIIEELYFDHVEFFIDIYNVTGSSSNWKTIIQNMSARAQQKRADGLNPKGVVIKKLVIENLTFTYRHPTLTAGSYRTLKPIPKLVLYDIGKGHPVNAAELATLVSQVMIRQFATITGLTDLIRGLPLLPFDLLKRIFIHKDNQTSSLDEFFKISEPEKLENPSLFRKALNNFKKKSPSQKVKKTY
ncbi:MAG: hypothetical protein S4CHLAM7_09330 [Chlamydiae bacterium]|nr:hypothetical protein [Chlamydiota bacterium]